MGSAQSYPGLTQDVLEDYAVLTYLSKGEILYLMKKFYSIDPEKIKNNYHHRFRREDIVNKFCVLKNNPFQDRIFKVFSSKEDDCFSFEDMVDLCSAMSAGCPADVKSAWAFKIFVYTVARLGSILPGRATDFVKYLANLTSTIFSLFDLPVTNLSSDYLWRHIGTKNYKILHGAISSLHTHIQHPEIILQAVGYTLLVGRFFSIEVCGTYKIHIHDDLDDDGQITEKDIGKIVDRLTRSVDKRCSYNNHIDQDSKLKIAKVILQEINLDNSGGIGLHEFKLIMARQPEFPTSFYFRL